MYHLHLARNLRSLAFIALMAFALAGIGTLWWANSTGMPKSWRVAIENEISKQGAYVKIGGLSYHPLRGITANKVHVYTDPLKQHEVSYLESVILDFDNTKMARGEIKLTKIELNDASLSLPIDPENPDSEILDIRHANGTFFLPGKRRLEVRNATGTISGINVTLNARFTGNNSQPEGESQPQSDSKRKELIARIIKELEEWDYDKDSPPELNISIEHKSADSSQSVAKLSLQTKQLSKNLHQLEEIRAEAEITGNLFTVTSIEARDNRGTLSGNLDYDINKQDGRFNIQSSLEIPPLLQAWFGLPPLRDVLITGKQEIKTRGQFSITPGQAPKIHLTGTALCESVMLKGVRFDSASTAFAWNESDLFLRDIQLSRDDGTATGKALIQWPIVRLAIDSTMPTSVYKPLYINKPLGKVLNNFSDDPKAHTHIKIEGGFDLTDRRSWAYTGTGTIKNSSYQEVPIDQANCKFSASYHKLDFYDGRIDFNYKDYPLSSRESAKKQGSASVSRILYEKNSNSVTIENIKGDFWPAPMIRMFAPNIANSLEIYQFHQPPTISGSGTVSIKNKDQTSLNVAFNSTSKADYRLLGTMVTLSQPRALVQIRGTAVNIKDLNAELFSGPVVANIEVDKDKKIKSEIQWTKLSVRELADTYGLTLKGGGDITGRVEFSMKSNQIETMNGKGLLAVENTELFSVPIFGPLSPVISGVLGDRRAGFERAKSAFCDFAIEDGILSTDNFMTATSSIVFTGDGEVDLAKKTIDMTMRLNARGLLGILTLPLRPFYGMFQFRGTGPLANTSWKHVMFTPPPDPQKKVLLNPPKATVVDP